MKQSQISQIEVELADVHDRNHRVDLLNRLSRLVHYKDLPRAIALSKISHDLAQEGDFYLKGLADSLVNLSQYSIDQTEYAEALDHATYALGIYNTLDHPPGKALARNRLGRINLYLGDYSAALDEHLEELAIAEGAKLDKSITQALNSIGNIYSRIHQTDKAIKYYERCLEMSERARDLDDQCRAIVNLAICYIQKGDYAEAMLRATAGLELAEACDNVYVKSWSYRILGEAHLHLERYDEARKYLLEHLQHAEQIGDMQQRLDALIYYGELEIETGNDTHAVTILEEVVQLAEKNDIMPHLYRALSLLSRAHKNLGNAEQALASFERFHLIKEQVFNAENERKFRQLESAHRMAEAQQEAQIYRLKTIELEERVRARTLELAKSLSREAELNELNARMIDNISHEFRTPLAIISTAANMLSRYSEQLEQANKVEYHARIVSQVKYLDALLDDVTVVSRTHRAEIEPTYLPYSFSQLANELSSTWISHFAQQISLQIEYDRDDFTMISVDPILWQQIGFNLLANGVKYAGASGEVCASLSCDSTHLYLQVTDNGVGIPAGEEEKIFDPLYRGSNVGTIRGMGLGLNIVKNLALAMGGNIIAQSAGPNQGCSFILTIPARP